MIGINSRISFAPRINVARRIGRRALFAQLGRVIQLLSRHAPSWDRATFYSLSAVLGAPLPRVSAFRSYIPLAFISTDPPRISRSVADLSARRGKSSTSNQAPFVPSEGRLRITAFHILIRLAGQYVRMYAGSPFPLLDFIRRGAAWRLGGWVVRRRFRIFARLLRPPIYTYARLRCRNPLSIRFGHVPDIDNIWDL